MQDTKDPNAPKVWGGNPKPSRKPLFMGLGVTLVVGVAGFLVWNMSVNKDTVAAPSAKPSINTINTTSQKAMQPSALPIASAEKIPFTPPVFAGPKPSTPATQSATLPPLPITPVAPPPVTVLPVKRPYATLPWNRLGDKIETTTIEPSRLPWKRKEATYVPVRLKEIKLPWKRQLPVQGAILERAKLPWDIYTGQ